MKELSIEEKAKAYDMALERARQLCDYPTTKPFISDLQDLFPELKESEDERIRKALIKYFTLSDEHAYDEACGVSYRDIVAWLEKQGEQKQKIQPKFKIGDIIKFKGNETLKGEAETHKIVSYDNELYVFADGTTDLFCEQDLYELVEQNPAWSEEDASLCVKIQGILSVCKSHSLLSPDLCKEMCDWLESLKCRVLPELKQEWSEEDEKMIGNIRRIIEQYAFSKSAVDVNGELCEKEFIDADNWLKSLRHQSHWKPTEEQMITLRQVISGCSYDIEPLVELETKLKEL